MFASGAGVPGAGVALERDGTGLLTLEPPLGWGPVDDPDGLPAPTVVVEDGAVGPVAAFPVVDDSLGPGAGCVATVVQFAAAEAAVRDPLT